MSLPILQGIGVAVAGIGEVQPTWPTHQPGDLGVLYVQTGNEVATLSDARGFVEIPNSSQGVGTPGALGSTRLTVFLCRATGAMAAPTVADSGNHQLARIFTLRNVRRAGIPYDDVAGDTAASSTSVSIPGGATTVPDCLIAAMVADAIDATGPRGSDWANADLGSVTEAIESGTGSGNGGGVIVVTGEKVVPGAFGATTGTLSPASAQARVMIAFAGEDPVGHKSGHVTGHIVGHIKP